MKAYDINTVNELCMIPAFDPDGMLPPGIHWATWEEVVARFGYTPQRSRLLQGLRRALDSLALAGCSAVYLDGSFVTAKHAPNDFDACWDLTGVDPHLLDPLLLDLRNGRAAQKAFYLGELFPAQWQEGRSQSPFLEFFQTDRETGRPKGIIAIAIGIQP